MVIYWACYRDTYLTIVTTFKLEAGSENHEHSSQHHVRGLVEEIVVQLGGVQQNLQVAEVKKKVKILMFLHLVTCSPLYLLDLLHQYQTATGRPIMKMSA